MIKSRLALLVQAEMSYETLKLNAHVMYVNYDEPQPVLSPSWQYGEHEYELYAGLRATSYLGGFTHEDNTPWGFGYGYSDIHQIDKAAQAQAIFKTLTKLDKGMDKLNSEEGYPRNGDFSTYVLRFARILGIKMFYVRATPGYRSNTGEPYRKVDGSGVQDYVLTATRLLDEGKRSELVIR